MLIEYNVCYCIVNMIGNKYVISTGCPFTVPGFTLGTNLHIRSISSFNLECGARHPTSVIEPSLAITNLVNIRTLPFKSVPLATSVLKR